MALLLSRSGTSRLAHATELLLILTSNTNKIVFIAGKTSAVVDDASTDTSAKSLPRACAGSSLIIFCETSTKSLSRPDGATTESLNVLSSKAFIPLSSNGNKDWTGGSIIISSEKSVTGRSSVVSYIESAVGNRSSKLFSSDARRFRIGCSKPISWEIDGSGTEHSTVLSSAGITDWPGSGYLYIGTSTFMTSLIEETADSSLVLFEEDSKEMGALFFDEISAASVSIRGILKNCALPAEQMLEPLLSQLNEMRIILASSSKQRSALLSSTDPDFEPMTPEEDYRDLSSTIRDEDIRDIDQNSVVPSNRPISYRKLKGDTRKK
nr:unnamed protein product [Callosobruchus chinensis]